MVTLFFLVSCGGGCAQKTQGFKGEIIPPPIFQILHKILELFHLFTASIVATHYDFPVPDNPTRMYIHQQVIVMI